MFLNVRLEVEKKREYVKNNLRLKMGFRWEHEAHQKKDIIASHILNRAQYFEKFTQAEVRKQQDEGEAYPNHICL